MTDKWTDKLDLYLDGELSAAEMRDLDAHLRICPSCSADALARLQLKRAVHSAGKRFTPSADFRQRMQKQIARQPQRSAIRVWLTATAVAVIVLVAAVVPVALRREQLTQRRVFEEIADQHVATLASANPVDVVSSDRHTVKPWFQGKIPFTFNLPELQNSEFTLLGGRMAYLGQAPGAEVIYQIRQHRISVFIFPDQLVGRKLNSDTGLQKQFSFNVESWSRDGLRYFVIGDASSDDIRNLTDLLKKAGG